MTRAFSDEELLAYLDECLAVPLMAEVERRLRIDRELSARLSRLLQDRDQGGLTLGEIWRRFRVSCPPRSALANWILGVATPEWSDYLRFHVEIVGCRWCAANAHDLRASSTPSRETQQRRAKVFQSSAGIVRRWSPDWPADDAGPTPVKEP